ncbi:MAG: hypothetical protein ACRBB0_18520 [Pelagimonas sp.]|uniref:hypothetical protein n=1 Tax=Pelagimonas sp. TaxID=2073170 RepID=UPI003D6C104F
MRWHELTTVTKSAMLVAVLGFAIKLTSTGTVSANGTTVCTHMDFAALCLGGLTMALASTGIFKARDLETGRALNLWLCLTAVAVGLLHLVRGLGIVGGPC